ncbi:hypothetical protein BGHDH14_bgh06577 [Blumeria hordei DH14]|uniref:Nucleoporin NUP120 n=1 Tax=Blumeria graminis f. sp. hordei (strain DH14) TaxID=546991 RepID=N1J6A2_BLUG1|nr:hypothetical protein BGHDH14_bgh06577 [Blumeria hordei DH14]
MKFHRIPFSYRETRLDLDSATQGSTTSISLPAASSSFSSINYKRQSRSDSQTSDDESSFRQKNLASSSAIYHRNYHHSPRSFLWRVTENERVLSVRIVDIFPYNSDDDTAMTLRLVFPHAILPDCVALSDFQEKDLLSIFVLTDAKQVWTLDIYPCFFFERQRLTRTTPTGSFWKEQQYNEGGWGHSFRSMVPFTGSNGVRYRDQIVQGSAATSIASPVTQINNNSFAFTVTVDHRLRIWNLSLGKIAYSGDILTQEAEVQDGSKKIIDPSYSQLVKVVRDWDDKIICATYSPLGSGEFKFWKLIGHEDVKLELLDLFPENVLVPQAPTSDIWNVADFSVIMDQNQEEKVTLWILWKNNVTYRLHKLEFKTGSIGQVRTTWSDKWVAVALDKLEESSIPTILPSDPLDATDKWLKFILSSGRYTIPTIETGLAIYEHGLGYKIDSNGKERSLASRMCAAIASTSTLTHMSDNISFEQFRSSTHIQWLRFYRLLNDLHKQRGEALSLTIEPEGHMPWVVLADGVSVIRACSSLERVWYNNEPINGSDTISSLLYSAANFWDSLPDYSVRACSSALLEEVHQESFLLDSARMTEIYEKCDFINQVTNEDYDELFRNLGEHISDLTPEIYASLIELISPAEGEKKFSRARNLAEFGNKLLVKGVQDTVELHRSICLEQLIIAMFTEFELIDEYNGKKIETVPTFKQLLLILKRLELIRWLTNTQICIPLKSPDYAEISQDNRALTKPAIEGVQTITVFEGVLRHLFSLDLEKTGSLPSLVTDAIVGICAHQNRYETPTAVIQCFLLKHNRPDLSIEFSRFSGQDAFSIYIMGRTHLINNEIVVAAEFFKKAAFGMGIAGYLNESEKLLFNAGLPKYYAHITDLFEMQGLHSFVVDFARLSIQFVKFDECEYDLHQRMCTSLFSAALYTARYEIAYSSLLQFKKVGLQASYLEILITKMCESSHASELIEFPFIGLHDQVDRILSQKCQNITSISHGIPYHKILYAWRIRRGNFRGAAATLFERLLFLKDTRDGDKMIESNDDHLETPVTRQYISLLNTLGCVDPQQAWILSDHQRPPSYTHTRANLVPEVSPKRVLITLADLKRSYHEELDRIATIQNNQFAFAGGDEMDVL